MKLLYAFPVALLLTSAAQAQNLTAPPPLGSVPVPAPLALMNYVKDKKAAINLGKALVLGHAGGQRRMQACASCHFHAGADFRTKNTVAPGGRTATFQPRSGAERTITAAIFPTHSWSDRDDRLWRHRGHDDIVGSQACSTRVHGRPPGLGLRELQPGGGHDLPRRAPQHAARDGQNAPSVINAVFNYNNFWDGRANNVFNGVDPFGDASVNARIFQSDGSSTLTPVAVRLENSSLASQAVGPPGNSTEMSYAGPHLPGHRQEAARVAAAGAARRARRPTAASARISRNFGALDPARPGPELLADGQGGLHRQVLERQQPGRQHSRRAGRTIMAAAGPAGGEPIHPDAGQLLALLRPRHPDVRVDADVGSDALRQVPGRRHDRDEQPRRSRA